VLCARWVHAPAAEARCVRLLGFGASVRHILLAAALVTAACAPRPRPAASPTPGATQARLDSVALASASPRARCYVRVFQTQWASGSSCMTSCILGGLGRNIGGGCWHICYAYSGYRMPPQRLFAACPPRAEPTPESLPYKITCQVTPGAAARLAGTVIDSAGRAVAAQVAVLGATPADTVGGLVTHASSSGDFEFFDVPPGDHLVQVRSMVGTRQVGPYTARAGEICKLEVRLRPATDEGY